MALQLAFALCEGGELFLEGGFLRGEGPCVGLFQGKQAAVLLGLLGDQGRGGTGGDASRHAERGGSEDSDGGGAQGAGRLFHGCLVDQSRTVSLAWVMIFASLAFSALAWLSSD